MPGKEWEELAAKYLRTEEPAIRYPVGLPAVAKGIIQKYKSSPFNSVVRELTPEFAELLNASLTLIVLLESPDILNSEEGGDIYTRLTNLLGSHSHDWKNFPISQLKK